MNEDIPPATSVKQVFISHATEDADFAHRLADDLQRMGVPVWIAPESILPGESWVQAIQRGLSESSHVVIALTPAALESLITETPTEITTDAPKALTSSRCKCRPGIPMPAAAASGCASYGAS